MDYDNIKTHTIDSATFVANNKVEFRLQPNTVYRSNLKLMGVGFRDTANQGKLMNALVGPLGQIKSIKLVDKGVEISKQMFVNPLMGYLNQMGENVAINNVEDVMKNTSVSLKFEIADGEAAGGLPAGNAADTGLGINIGKNHFMDTIAQNENKHSELDLSLLLPLLGNMEFIPTNVFDDLKVVVEFFDSITAAKYVSDDIRVRASNATLDPVMYLMAEEVLGNEAQDAMDDFRSLSWNEIEHDQVFISAGTQNVQQETKKRLKGFDNKSLGRLLLITEPADGAIIDGNVVKAYGRNSSQAQKDLEVNYIVNGKQLLTNNGVEKPASRMAITVDSYGDYVSFIGANDNGLANKAVWIGDGDNLEGMTDYLGVSIGTKIQNLQIEHKRTPPDAPNTGRNVNLTLHFYGEVGKSLVVGNGSYTIVYN